LVDAGNYELVSLLDGKNHFRGSSANIFTVHPATTFKGTKTQAVI